MSEEAVSSESAEESSTPEEVASTEGNLEVSEEVSEDNLEVTESAAAPQLFELKVDGQVLHLTQEEVIELAQKGKSSVKRFQEAAQAKKEIAAERAAIQAALHGRPEDLFDMKFKAGLMRPEDLEQWIIQKAIELADREELTPEQRKMKEMEDELNRYKAQKEEEEQKTRTESFHREVERAKEDFSTKILNEINSGGLEASPFAIQRVASVLRDSMDDQGNITIEVADAVQYVKEQEHGSYNEYIKSLEVDRLESLFGEEKLKKIRSKDLEKLKNPAGKAKSPFASSAPKPATQKVSATEFFKNLGK